MKPIASLDCRKCSKRSGHGLWCKQTPQSSKPVIILRCQEGVSRYSDYTIAGWPWLNRVGIVEVDHAYGEETFACTHVPHRESLLYSTSGSETEEGVMGDNDFARIGNRTPGPRPSTLSLHSVASPEAVPSSFDTYWMLVKLVTRTRKLQITLMTSCVRFWVIKDSI